MSTKINEDETNAQVPINILLINAYKIQVGWLHFDDDLCLQKSNSCMASSPINLFLWLTKHIHVSGSSNQTDNTKFFNPRSCRRF